MTTEVLSHAHHLLHDELAQHTTAVDNRLKRIEERVFELDSSKTSIVYLQNYVRALESFISEEWKDKLSKENPWYGGSGLMDWYEAKQQKEIDARAAEKAIRYLENSGYKVVKEEVEGDTTT